jgi:hypothetical protein
MFSDVVVFFHDVKRINLTTEPQPVKI